MNDDSPSYPRHRVPLMGLLDKIADATVASYDRNRKANPHRFANGPDGLGPDHLFVENVARMLACNVDHVRRIPRAELPVSKIGARVVYARRDVENYIASKRDAGTSRYVAARTPRKKLNPVATDAPSPGNGHAATFDPVMTLKAIQKRDRQP